MLPEPSASAPVAESGCGEAEVVTLGSGLGLLWCVAGVGDADLGATDWGSVLAFASAVCSGARSGMYKLTAVGDGVLHAGMTRQFEDMWRRARRAGGKD